jgi:hypothetical protein
MESAVEIVAYAASSYISPSHNSESHLIATGWRVHCGLTAPWDYDQLCWNVRLWAGPCAPATMRVLLKGAAARPGRLRVGLRGLDRGTCQRAPVTAELEPSTRVADPLAQSAPPGGRFERGQGAPCQPALSVRPGPGARAGAFRGASSATAQHARGPPGHCEHHAKKPGGWLAQAGCERGENSAKSRFRRRSVCPSRRLCVNLKTMG